MRFSVLTAAIFCAAILAPLCSIGEETAAKLPNLQCNVGPVSKTYGKMPWLVYSCDDNSTLIIASAAGNPAMPFYFTFAMYEDGYQLHGEGEAPQAMTKPAFAELKKLSTPQIAALIKETKIINGKL